MNCTSARHQLDELRAGTLAPPVAREVQQHLDQCAACRAFQRDIKIIQDVLAHDTGPRLGPEFARQTLERFHQPPPRRWAIAASAAFVAALGAGALLKPDLSPELAATEQATIPTIEHMVRLRVNANSELTNVRFRIDLPEAVEVIGHPSRQFLEWQDDLMAGANHLDIPVRITGQPSGALVARIDHGNLSREIPVALPITQAETVKPN